MGIFDFFSKKLSNYELVILLYHHFLQNFGENLTKLKEITETEWSANNLSISSHFTLNNFFTDKEFLDLGSSLCLIFKSLEQKYKFKKSSFSKLRNTNLYKNSLLKEIDINDYYVNLKFLEEHKDLTLNDLKVFLRTIMWLGLMSKSPEFLEKRENLKETGVFLFSYFSNCGGTQLLSVITVANNLYSKTNNKFYDIDLNQRAIEYQNLFYDME